MSEFKITGPGFYKTRSGGKVEIAGRLSSPGDSAAPWLGRWTTGITSSWGDNGRWDPHAPGMTLDDLIAPWTEPKKGTVWVNVFQRQSGKIGFAGYFASRAEADADAALARVSIRLACVSVNWTEGEGL